MDSGKDGARQAVKEEVARLEKEVYGESFNVDFEQMRLLTRAQREFTLSFLDKVINSRWTRGDKKDYFKLFRALVVEDGKNKDNIIKSAGNSKFPSNGAASTQQRNKRNKERS